MAHFFIVPQSYSVALIDRGLSLLLQIKSVYCIIITGLVLVIRNRVEHHSFHSMLDDQT